MSNADPTIGLLRTIARDVAHELRGPVQSVLVNLEVLRRRAQKGDAHAALERADLIEDEVRRMHALSDAFLALLRPPEPEPRPLAVERLLAALDPITIVHAKNGRLSFQRPPVDDALFVRVRAAAASLALLHLFAAVCAACGAGAAVVLSCRAQPDAITLRIEGSAVDAGHFDPSAVADGVCAAAAWLDAGGTVTREPVSQTHGIAVDLRLPRVVSLTSASPQD